MRITLLISLVSCLLLVGCSKQEKYDVRLKLAGSSTVGKGFAPDLVKGFLTTELEVDSITEVRRGGEELDILGWKDGRAQAVRISSHGTATGFDSLANERADIVMASRPIKKDENERFKYDLRNLDTEHNVALDGIAIIVNKANPLNQLSITQLMKVFSGDIANWQVLNGKKHPINVFVRDEQSGTYDSFQSLVLKPYKAALTPTLKGNFDNNADVAAAVAKDPFAIGFVSYQAVGQAKALGIADTEGRDYQPMLFTIKTETYPLSRRLYLYHSPNPKNKFALDFMRYAKSEAGQNLLVRSGFISPNLFLATGGDLPEDAPPLYRQLLTKASRIPINIYFTPGSHQFDRDALVKLGEINRMLRQKEYVNRQVLLMGFSDASGSLQIQEELALLRARKVQQYLREYGNSRSSVFSFGSQMPMASSLSYEGRSRNSRVEVWVR